MGEKGTGFPSVARIAALLLAALWLVLAAVTCVWLYQSYETTNRRIGERLGAASTVVATNASFINALAAQALRRIDETLPQQIAMADGDQIRNIDDAVEGLPGVVQAYVVDAGGETIYSTDPKIRPVNITDREYFAALKNGARDYVSPLLVSRLNGEQIFVFSRRLERNGVFAGAAMVSFEANVLASVWRAVDLGNNSTISLIRKDGQLVARFPLADGPLDMSGYVLFTDYLPKAPSGTYEAISPLDEAHRMVGYQAVNGAPFVALAALDYREAMEPFRRNAVAAAILGILTTAGAAITGWWIRTLYRRDRLKTAALEAANSQNALLLREIHHRVKNNLQSVQSLLRMQGLPPDAQKSLSARIMAMIAVHEQIYRNDAFAMVELRNLIPAVVDKLVEAYEAPVEITYAIDAVEVSGDHATSIALLLNEVVTNSLKYACEDMVGLRLSISASATGRDRMTLTVSDNGNGFDPEAVPRGMGSRLINGVVRQLNGGYRYEINGGTTFIADLDLKMMEKAGAAG